MKTTIQRLLPRATAASTSAPRWPAKIEMMTSVPMPNSCPRDERQRERDERLDLAQQGPRAGGG